jgi:hypothetical protein
MHMTMQYRTAAGRARNAAEKTVGFWTRGARTVTDLVPGPLRVDLVPAVERYFDLVLPQGAAGRPDRSGQRRRPAHPHRRSLTRNWRLQAAGSF